MLQKPRECDHCPLEHIGKGFIRPEGLGSLGVAAVGEAGGAEEAWDGLPFRPKAQAGSKLEECFKLSGHPRGDFLITNLLSCQPPGNELRGAAYQHEAINHCKVHFDAAIKKVRTGNVGKKVYLALGAVPISTLSGMGLDERGFVLDAKDREGLVVGTFHPSFLRRNAPELTPLVAFDIQRAVDVASGKFKSYPSHPDYEELNIQEFPTLEDAWSFYYKCKENGKLIISFDIETPKSGWVLENERDLLEEAQIFQIQFSVNMREAIVFPWKQPYLDVVVALFLLPNVKANHFAYNFDIPRLEQAGVKINGTIHDTLWMFKHWHPRLPRGLQSVASMVGFPFPWKHYFGERPQWYGGCDVIAIHYILRWLPEKMKQLGVWQGYLEEILEEWKMLKGAAVRGVPVSESRRLVLGDELRAERRTLHKRLQELIPEELKNILPKRKVQGEDGTATDYGFVRPPKALLASCREAYNNWLSRYNGHNITFEEYLNSVLLLRGKPNKDGKRDEFRLQLRKLPVIDAASGEIRYVERWCKIMMFKGSSQQLIKYIDWKRESLQDDPLGAITYKRGSK